MSSPHKILDFYASKTWAIQENSLQEMYGIYQAALQRRSDGVDFDPEAVAAKTGTRLDNTRSVEVRDGVAVIPVRGPIFARANLFTQISGATSIEVLAKDFNEALENPRVKSILFEINSPGGEVDGTSEFAQHIFDAREQKPIVAYVAHLGASAAYWIASATDEIVAQETASLGSIGVVGTVCVHKDKGHIEFVSSQSPNKRPNPETEAGRSQIQEHIDDLAQVFINTVARNRDWTAGEVIEKGGAGGLRVGQKAVDSGLADRLGTLEGLISELSSDMWKRKRKSGASAENLNSKPVLQDAGQSFAGEESMADEKKDSNAEEKAQAVDDKTLGEKIKAGIVSFFSERADTAPTPTDAKAEEDRTAIAAAQARAEAAEKEAKAANDRIAQLEKDARTARFSSLAKDWPGEPTKHVAMLEILASQEGGEESQAFKDYVTQQKAIGEQLKTAALFQEIGSSQPVEGSISAKVEADIRKRMEADSKLTYEVAFDQARAALPVAQRQEYDNEQRRSVN